MIGDREHMAAIASLILADPFPGRALHTALIAAETAIEADDAAFFEGMARGIEIIAFGPTNEQTIH